MSFPQTTTRGRCVPHFLLFFCLCTSAACHQPDFPPPIHQVAFLPSNKRSSPIPLTLANIHFREAAEIVATFSMFIVGSFLFEAVHFHQLDTTTTTATATTDPSVVGRQRHPLLVADCIYLTFYFLPFVNI